MEMINLEIAKLKRKAAKNHDAQNKSPLYSAGDDETSYKGNQLNCVISYCRASDESGHPLK